MRTQNVKICNLGDLLDPLLAELNDDQRPVSVDCFDWIVDEGLPTETSGSFIGWANANDDGTFNSYTVVSGTAPAPDAVVTCEMAGVTALNSIVLESTCVTSDGTPVVAFPVVTVEAATNSIVGVPLYLDETGRPITGVIANTPDCDCAIECCDRSCDVTIQMSAFDSDRGLVTVGDTSTHEIVLDGVSQATIVHDYTTSSDGVNVSSFYTPIVAAVNALADWAMSVNTDVAIADQGKVVWDVNFTGTGPSKLEFLYHGDTLTIDVDADCNISGISNDGGSGAPFGTPAF